MLFAWTRLVLSKPYNANSIKTAKTQSMFQNTKTVINTYIEVIWLLLRTRIDDNETIIVEEKVIQSVKIKHFYPTSNHILNCKIKNTEIKQGWI